ncbi:uncharacterized protein LOC111359841 isoform X2 [Spodoptera litura]|uniref:Uncharacterized protein LOC111359841 isoform X2 n=1 Tax=Spodoptera litura TaxID=69820 RepID=A0A9J7EI43_SPOLT|nr:uncharacterized protein LOC111359841 isoform X2 [Spodoptera litura]
MNSRKENTRTCCLCGSSPCKDPSINLYRFPKPGTQNAMRCELWAKYCYPNEDWSSPQFQNEMYAKHKMLCSKHFESTCFIEKKLFRTAVPGFKCAVLHAFPNPTTECGKFHTWVVNAGLVGEDYDYIYLNRRICRLHFENIYHYPKNRLSKFAIPTLHLPDCDRFELSPTTKDEESSLAASPLPPSSLQLPSSRPTHVPFVINILEPLLQIVNNLKLLLVTAQAHDVQ